MKPTAHQCEGRKKAFGTSENCSQVFLSVISRLQEKLKCIQKKSEPVPKLQCPDSPSQLGFSF